MKLVSNRIKPNDLAFTPGKPCRGCGKENHSFTDQFHHEYGCPQYAEWATKKLHESQAANGIDNIGTRKL